MSTLSVPTDGRCFAVLLLVAVSSGVRRPVWGQEPATKATAKDTCASEKTEKGKGGEAVRQAALAVQLVLEGEKRHSPTLLLAAAELLGSLRASPRKADLVKIGAAKAPAGKEAPQLDLLHLIQQARVYAKGDASLTALLDSRAEQLSRRGLSHDKFDAERYESGGPLVKVKVEDTTFVVLDQGVLGAGEEVRLRGVIFEGGQRALVAAIGDGDGDLELWVYDETNGRLIDSDTDATSKCWVSWTPRYRGPFTIRLVNTSRSAVAYVILANW